MHLEGVDVTEQCTFDKKAKAVLEIKAMVEVDRHFQAITTKIICPAVHSFGRTSIP